MGFHRDLKSGKLAEVVVLDIFKNFGLEGTVNRDKDYDMFINNEFTLEVKYDVYASRSGNIAIEYFNPKSNKNSGVSATIADLWVHILTNPQQIWVTPVSRLVKYCNEESPHKMIECGGDKNSAMLLFRKENILSIFTELDKLNLDEIKELVNESRKNKTSIDFDIIQSRKSKVKGSSKRQRKLAADGTSEHVTSSI